MLARVVTELAVLSESGDDKQHLPCWILLPSPPSGEEIGCFPALFFFFCGVNHSDSYTMSVLSMEGYCVHKSSPALHEGL